MVKGFMSFEKLEHLEEKLVKLVDSIKFVRGERDRLSEERDCLSLEVDRLRQEVQDKDHTIECLNQEKVDFLKTEEDYKRLQGERSQVQERLENMLKGLEEIEV